MYELSQVLVIESSPISYGLAKGTRQSEGKNVAKSARSYILKTCSRGQNWDNSKEVMDTRVKQVGWGL